MSTHDPTTQNRGVLPVVLLSLALVVAAVPALNVALPEVLWPYLRGHRSIPARG